MTGYGEARSQDPAQSVLVEVRTVNNRHFKFSARLPDALAALDGEMERLVRDKVRRGTIQLSVRLDRPGRPDDYRLNLTALASYRDQLADWLGDPAAVPVAALLSLPGVVRDEASRSSDPHELWGVLEPLIREALVALEKSRAEDGRAMASELAALADHVENHLDRVVERIPQVVNGYQARLTERIQALLKDQGVVLEPSSLIREIAIFSDRSDVSEEIVRLRAHLVQFRETLQGGATAGRKLEFVVQEMGREANTLGSKANDVQISREVVEIKGYIERIRELIQNVE